MKFSIAVLLSLLGSVVLAAPPDSQAEKTALASPRAKALYGKLKDEARKIRDARLRAETLALLEYPEFKVVEARRGSEREIVKQLKAEKLLEGSLDQPIFPDHPPMSFIAAAGGSWNGHHRFPGGLVYHTLTNLKLGLAYADVYKEVHGLNLDRDLIRAAAIWHDSAKTLMLSWNPDGSETLIENKIAGTFTHHIWAVSEAIFRGYPPRFIVALASAHSPATPDQDLKALIGYLKAGALIAGRPYDTAGLTLDGKALAEPATIEAFVNHLADHDYAVSMVSMDQAARLVDEALGAKDFWARDRFFSETGDMQIYDQLVKTGPEQTKKWISEKNRPRKP